MYDKNLLSCDREDKSGVSIAKNKKKVLKEEVSRCKGIRRLFTARKLKSRYSSW